MRSVEREFEIRKVEIQNCINFIKKMEDDSFSILNNEAENIVDTTALRTSIKSGIIIMLYNLVESTMTMSLSKIHEALKAREVRFEELNRNLKKMIIVYYSYIFEKKRDIHNSFDHVMELIGHLRGELLLNTTYKDLSEYYPLYSGNLDGKEIKNVLSKYGIEINTRISELQTIKNLRNALAHGEQSFEEVGRGLTLQQLTVCFQRSADYLNEIINEIITYIQEESYRQ
jgi:hypothetical protein